MPKITCSFCGIEHECSPRNANVDSPVLPCNPLCEIRVHIVDELSYRSISQPVPTFLTGDQLGENGNLTESTDKYGVAAYKDLKPGRYTVWLSTLSKDIPKTHRAPAKDFRDLTLSAGEVAYVPFFLPRAPKWLRLQLFDLHVPRAEQAFTLQLTSERGESLGAAIQGVTDASGILEKEVDANSTNAVIVIGPDEQTITVTLSNRELNQEEPDLRKRLNHLGYSSAAATEDWAAAIRTFERDHGLNETGTCKDQTLTKLLEVHDKAFAYTDSRK